ncbi:uncharacterized protein LOC129572062 [Sitodiplosis mosellana]|uniref:uncharacterized protein LOC129572062 n=1 Tax=Sitodiplosis mosellana TaxID=263140 RepID=UPI00244377AC|nr:uncharacterized protein LOC129572062 [Sitodiplosis mosellana]
MQNMQLKAENKYIWASIDESTDSEGRMVVNFIFGILDDCKNSPERGIQYNKVLLALTDSASYMLAAMKGLQILYSKMLHVTCLSHGLHRVAEFIRDKFSNVNQLISKTKAVFLKAPSRRMKFQQMNAGLALPPEPVITRWGTWLNAAIYYCDHFSEVKSVIDTFDIADAESIGLAQQAFNNGDVEADLAYIKTNFASLIAATVKLETQGLALSESIEIVTSIRNELRSLSRQEFTRKFEAVLKRNRGFIPICDINNILNRNMQPTNEYVHNLTSHELALFAYAPLSSADVERSFSDYKNVLTLKRRSFLFENVKQHVIVLCNECKQADTVTKQRWYKGIFATAEEQEDDYDEDYLLESKRNNINL